MKTKTKTGNSPQTAANLSDVHVKQQETEQTIVQVFQFAQQCRYEQGHSGQVLRLSVMLFKKLEKLHNLGSDELFLLTCAAILHDIGWIEGRAGHHKAAVGMILNAKTLPLSEAERKMAAMIARYHRKALPKPEHAVYKELSKKQQKLVRLLGGILRIADGLDRSHASAVEDVEVRISDETAEFRCRTRGTALPEMLAAKKKADLFEKVFGYTTLFISKPSAVAKDSTPAS